MIKFIIVDDKIKWIDEYEKIINDVAFNSNKQYEIKKFKKYDEDLHKLILDNSEQKIYLMDLVELLELDKEHYQQKIL